MTTSSSLAPEALGPTVTVGEILVEIMSTTAGNGFLEEQMFSGPYASGAPAIFIDQVARFGGSAGIISCVGNDDFGKLNLNRLSADGVDVSAVATSVDRPTGSAFVRYRADGSRDFVFNIAHSAAGETAIEEAGKALLASAGHLHIMGSAFSIKKLGREIVRSAFAVKQRGGSVSLDPNLRKELLEDGDIAKYLDDVLAVTDLLLPSGEELLTICGQAHEEDAVEVLLQRGVKEIVLKRGKEGATLFTATDAPVHCPAFKVEEIDPTGAGDCFGATYLTSRRMGMTAEQSLQFANAAGAFAVTRLGPMEGVASRLELEQFIASQEQGA
jgi:sugar/nucleoside kinase (ribokinase family)